MFNRIRNWIARKRLPIGSVWRNRDGSWERKKSDGKFETVEVIDLCIKPGDIVVHSQEV